MKCCGWTRNVAKRKRRLQQLNADRKRLSKEIGGKRSRGESSEELEERVREIGDQISLLNEQTSAADEQQKAYSSAFRICRTRMRRLERTRARIRWCGAGAKNQR